MARHSAGESAFRRYLRVLDAFDAHRPLLGLTEIAASADLAMSTAHRIVGELEREGMLERLPDRTYRLGARLRKYASRTRPGLRDVSRPWLDAVHARVRQHTQLSVRSATDVLVVERRSARDAVIDATLMYGRVPLAVSSAGLVLLAHADDAVVDNMLVRGWPTPTPATLAGRDALVGALRTVHGARYADLRGHIHEDCRGIAVPIYGPGGTVLAALGVVVANDGSSVQPTVELLTAAAAGIRRALEAARATESGETGQESIPPLL